MAGAYKYAQERFASDKELIAFMKTYAEKVGFNYSTQGSKKIAAQPSKHKFINPNLVYLYMNFKCEHGGKYVPTGKGVKKRSAKTECPSIFKFKPTSDGNFFCIDSLRETHDHVATAAENTDDGTKNNTDTGKSNAGTSESTKSFEAGAGPSIVDDDSFSLELPKKENSRDSKINPENNTVVLPRGTKVIVIADGNVQHVDPSLDNVESGFNSHVLDVPILGSEEIIEILNLENNELETLSEHDDSLDYDSHSNNDAETIQTLNHEKLGSGTKSVVTAKIDDEKENKTDPDEEEDRTGADKSEDEIDVDEYKDKNEANYKEKITDETHDAFDTSRDTPKITYRKRGRPARKTTAIGLAKPKVVAIKRIKKASQAFSSKTIDEKVRLMLFWILADDELITQILSKEKTIALNDVSDCAEELNDSLGSKSVSINAIRKHCDVEAYKKLKNLVDIKWKEKLFNCLICKKRAVDLVVECSSCLKKLHFTCAKLKTSHPEKREFVLQRLFVLNY
ncbi:hypothetical protein KQX54_012375 [Cotesia glomerata]|uniref:ZSWIM3 N-terminal domain-containing protein n=1 Tax=Cotesia glomerata TaxID=32391 RepID=A0AAV7HUD0_COTGL|nr:hypothetical protein KQX54_012375 [Cotesia glomerata]